MLRRCRNWNYCGTDVYLITLVLNDRSLPLLGRLNVLEPRIDLTELGRRIEAHFRRIPEFTPEIEVLGVQVMPEHLHGVLRVTRRMAKPLGEHLRGFKIGATKIARELGCPGINAGIRGHGLFAYARNAKGEVDRSAKPLVETAEFKEKADALLAAAEHGTVLVSPCISHGEKEIARRAFSAGRRVISLSNKGFSPLYKPGGRLFDQCADGRLLMLAPAGWPYLPGEKKITRMDACALNRIAQLIAGAGAVEIDYKGVRLEGVDDWVFEVTRCAGGGA